MEQELYINTGSAYSQGILKELMSGSEVIGHLIELVHSLEHLIHVSLFE